MTTLGGDFSLLSLLTVPMTVRAETISQEVRPIHDLSGIVCNVSGPSYRILLTTIFTLFFVHFSNMRSLPFLFLFSLCPSFSFCRFLTFSLISLLLHVKPQAFPLPLSPLRSLVLTLRALINPILSRVSVKFSTNTRLVLRISSLIPLPFLSLAIQVCCSIPNI